MTERAEIERLLNQTGRTLEGLPEEHSTAEVIDCITCINAGQGAYRRATVFAERILHQSDVIELLVGALRDALDKPMQKPLTLEELNKAEVVWIEYSEEDEPALVFVESIGDKNAYFSMRRGVCVHAFIDQFGSMWRCWASRPTDEERSAAAWES